MKLSILIPVYNAEEHIGRCLDSLLDQNISQTDYEIILRDDGSTDGSVKIIKSYSNKISNIKFTEDKNRGAYVQRNILMNQATGKYIYFMDADDYLAKKSLDKILELAFVHNLDIACFDVELTTSKNSDNISLEHEKNLKRDPDIVSGKAYMEKHLEMRHEIWWYFIKAEYRKSLELSFDEGRYHNDVLFTLNIFFNAKRIGYFPVSIYFYYQSAGSIMRSSDRAHNNRLIEAGKKLVSSLTSFIHTTEQSSASDRLVKNLKYKRDQYAFYVLLRMVKYKYSIAKIDAVKAYFKELAIYPLKFYTGKDMSAKKYKILNTLFHNRLLLVLYLKLSKAGLIR